MQCPSCDSALPASSVSDVLQAARCPTCRTLVDLTSHRFARPTRTELAAPIPERWKVEEGPRRLTARWGWFNLGILFLIPFTLFWNGILVTMGWSATGGGQHLERLLLGLAVPHVWVGIGLAYSTLAHLVNSTTVELRDGVLRVKKGPLPWLGNRSLPVETLRQLFVLEKRGSRGTRSYELCAVLRDGRKQTVVSGLSGPDHARFLETRLEHVLDLRDQPVDGEWRG